VVIWGTNPQKNREAATALRGHGGEVVEMICDVGNQASVVAATAEVAGRFGRIDSCFANAGVPGRAPSFVGMTDDEWHRVLRVNLDGAFYTAQESVKQMVAQGTGGSIVFTSSGSAYFGQQRGQHYGASKAGLISMSKGIAVEYARHGIRSNAIVAGWTESDMTSPALRTDAFGAKVLPRVPLRRWGEGADFAGIAVYLASRASSYHTGDVMTIDGGYYSF
jgi:NAD(P)-dependent dehydrogenase (short-subunit alcohol dehydrogenase family)